jgi:asparagine synthetase B (glutamine-hydrolysing)
MNWTFERVFYGSKEGLNLRSIWAFLMRGFYPIPQTLFHGYYRAVYRVGDHDSLYARIAKPFPDAILAQRPEGKLAIQLSGGFDSSIMAKLYDREDVDYIHFTGPESYKARALAKTLKGTLHEIQITPELFLREADELMPLLAEPYTFEDVVYCYIASKKARELGHDTIVTGDGGDWVFGGYNVGSGSADAPSADIWKTIEPNRLLGLKTLQPLGHQVLDQWSQTTLQPPEKTPTKQFARRYCRELGMPEEIVTQQKVPWAGSHGIRTNPQVLAHLTDVVARCDYYWIREFAFPQKPVIDLAFRQYGLVKWLQANHKPRLTASELQDLSQQVREFNAREGKVASAYRRKETMKRYCPPVALPAMHRMRDLLVKPGAQV